MSYIYPEIFEVRLLDEDTLGDIQNPTFMFSIACPVASDVVEGTFRVVTCQSGCL